METWLGNATNASKAFEVKARTEYKSIWHAATASSPNEILVTRVADCKEPNISANPNHVSNEQEVPDSEFLRKRLIGQFVFNHLDRPDEEFHGYFTVLCCTPQYPHGGTWALGKNKEVG